MTLELLRAFTKAGNYVGGAFEGDRLVGACVGFFHAPGEDALHSHIAGVAAGRAQRRLRAQAAPAGVGAAARRLARSRGPSTRWSRATPTSTWSSWPRAPAEYLPNFYGPMTDAINGEDDSDRLLVRWRLRDPAVALACAGESVGASAPDELAAGAVVALGVGADGGPGTGPARRRAALVAVPPDIEALRATDPALAQRWRLAVREALTGAGRRAAAGSTASTAPAGTSCGATR